VIQEILNGEALANDWRVEIADYLKNPSQRVTRKLRYKSTKYVLLDDQLHYKTVDGVLLKCLNQEEAKVLMGEVHEGICGAHQSAYKMKWIIRRSGYFWPTILEDCFEYYKGCQDYQRFGNIQKSSASAMNPIIKPSHFEVGGLISLARFFHHQVNDTNSYW
jgi:hypothetical protein